MDIEMNNYLNKQHFYPTWGRWFFLFENGLIYEVPEALRAYFWMKKENARDAWNKEIIVNLFYNFLRDENLTVLDEIYCLNGEKVEIKYYSYSGHFRLEEDTLPF